jgi:hypothetical protein
MNRTNYTRIETKNSLPQSIRLHSVGLLNRNLASAIDLERQAKQAHLRVGWYQHCISSMLTPSGAAT